MCITISYSDVEPLSKYHSPVTLQLSLAFRILTNEHPGVCVCVFCLITVAKELSREPRIIQG